MDGRGRRAAARAAGAAAAGAHPAPARGGPAAARGGCRPEGIRGRCRELLGAAAAQVRAAAQFCRACGREAARGAGAAAHSRRRALDPASAAAPFVKENQPDGRSAEARRHGVRDSAATGSGLPPAKLNPFEERVVPPPQQRRIRAPRGTPAGGPQSSPPRVERGGLGRRSRQGNQGHRSRRRGAGGPYGPPSCVGFRARGRAPRGWPMAERAPPPPVVAIRGGGGGGARRRPPPYATPSPRRRSSSARKQPGTQTPQKR